ncbi:MAG: hypothetical protein SVK08_13800, partial [Halobacteriota archaeon]|nr:hypothetical protein [Halobacteriota archaeon]
MGGIKTDSKIILLLVAVLAIGLFALPSAVAMFGGQHEWYELGAGGNQVPCKKCHANIYDEMYSMPAGVGAPHRTYPCAHCHRISGFGENNGSGYTYASGNGAGSTPGEDAHAASSVECMDCHDINYMFTRGPITKGPASDHHMYNPDYQVAPPEGGGGGPYPGCGFGPGDYGPYHCHAPPRNDWEGGNQTDLHNIHMIRAGGFGLTDFDNMSLYYYKDYKTWPEDTGEKAAHRAFVMDSLYNSDLMEGANEACITCHTHVAIDINWTHAYKMSLDADGSSGGDWVVDNFITEGTYNVTTYGNMSGEHTGVTDPV